ncbi:CPCC family cysteine-rich protein [Nannocystis radixulma]|uniref:CPCC family cysteine-rich protein n=1 Tax=Nannocystis radixulma TaxID=2995305 RepID=A0ABT5B382_9BACT|nr:CPCC family cysteine-rich protein [Nannocystis radixulma]MDC0668582.1 CPCC family cysteine-rich protein [Nannocystis radixulma]
MIRAQAIQLLARDLRARLSPVEREAELQELWATEGEGPLWSELPEALRGELQSGVEPTDPLNPRHDPLLDIHLARSFFGVTNEYLERRICALGVCEAVEGAVELLVPCPCCGYRSLGERGEYGICRVCFWEDDGMDELDRPSAANGMTLREARANFARWGAVAQAHRSHVLPDGPERYART